MVSTSRGFARGGSYERLAALATGRVLDLACGDRGGPAGIGYDASLAALRAATGLRVCGDARALPFADRTFDAVVCHLAFMLFADPARVVAELARVLAPGGRFFAILGGGPTAAGGDALAWFADRQPRSALPARLTEARWAVLFAGWSLAPWERWELELSGSHDDVCATLEAANDAAIDPATRADLRAAFPALPVPCRSVLWLAEARTP